MREKIDARIRCHAGFSGCDYPVTVEWNGQRKRVVNILSEWLSAEAKCYRLLLSGNLLIEAAYNLNTFTWQIKKI